MENCSLKDPIAVRGSFFKNPFSFFKARLPSTASNLETAAIHNRVLPFREDFVLRAQRYPAATEWLTTMPSETWQLVENEARPRLEPEAEDFESERWNTVRYLEHVGGIKPLEDPQTPQDSKPNKKKRSTKSANNKTPHDKLGGYTLGHTLGEGEFGKVRIGWKTPEHPTFKQRFGAKEKTVAVKIISRGKLNTQGRVAKVYREIAILKALDHPNIVHLYEMIDTETTFGLVLEYASGGELFDHILQHRYLDDHKARRLFAQLVSGVGYLHRNGIIHRDLKLENLLLDHAQNIIITDFGFANSFDPSDKLPEGTEYNLHDREFIENHGLDQIRGDNLRRGDLMSTSCGSPCYAAPELVVSDGLYCGTKVDVWSCGVILYAMLAGYLPFDDDPANPEGDNINLLYKYICTTPLIFPDYVSPHSRDILRRILVPDPTKRADLFEVARHSWLGDFSRTVEAVTSGVPMPNETRNVPQPPRLDDVADSEVFSLLARSSSVKESSKSNQGSSPLGGPTPKQAYSHIDRAAEASKDSPTPRDTKRRTVQVEYVPPHSQTARGNLNSVSSPEMGVPANDTYRTSDVRPVPPEKDYVGTKLVDAQPARNAAVATTDTTAFKTGQSSRVARPSTGTSATGGLRLPPSRGSYGQPSAAAVAPTNAQGRFSRPQSSIQPAQPPSHYLEGDPAETMGHDRVSTDDIPTKNTRRGHKRASTLGGLGEKILDRASSVRHAGARRGKHDRSYPPTSMRQLDNDASARRSNESRRSFGFPRKSSDIQPKDNRPSRRFSLLPRPKGQATQLLPNLQQTRYEPGTTQPNPVAPWSDGPCSTQGTTGTLPDGKWSQLPNKNRRFNDAYDSKEGAGSSGAARRVMEFFRRRK